MKKNRKIKPDGKVPTATSSGAASFADRGDLRPLLLLLLFAIPVLLYLQTVSFELVHFDDDLILTKNAEFLDHFGNVGKAFWKDAFLEDRGPFYRPLQTISYMIDRQISGKGAYWALHLQNVVLMGIVSCLLFLLLQRLGGQSLPSFLGSLLFCVHPLFTSTVAWIPSRGDLQLILFTLVSFLSLAEYCKTDRTIFLFLHGLAFTLALFSKETAIVLPLLFLLFTFGFASQQLLGKKNLQLIPVYAGSAIFWFFMRAVSAEAVMENARLGFDALTKNLTTPLETLARFFLPLQMAVIPGFSPAMALAGLILLSLLIVAVYASRQQTLLRRLFGLAWFLLLILPGMFYKHNFIDYLDHRSLLPLIGILMVLVLLFPREWSLHKEKPVTAVAVLGILLLSITTFLQSRNYSDPISFHNAAVRQNGSSVIAYHNRGIQRTIAGDKQGALDDFNRVMEFAIKPAEIYYRRGSVKSDLGDHRGALEDLNRAASLEAGNAEVFIKRGRAKGSLGDMPGAFADFNQAIVLAPSPAAYHNRGVVKFSMGDHEGALADLAEALKLDPANRDIARIRDRILQESGRQTSEK